MFEVGSSDLGRDFNDIGSIVMAATPRVGVVYGNDQNKNYEQNVRMHPNAHAVDLIR
jgi:hypothetical protein